MECVLCLGFEKEVDKLREKFPGHITPIHPAWEELKDIWERQDEHLNEADKGWVLCDNIRRG